MSDIKKYFCLPCENGSLKVAYDAVAYLAQEACLGVTGVSSLAYADAEDGAWVGQKGIVVAAGEAEGSCVLRVYIDVLFGNVISETAKNVQENVKASVESGTGLHAETVDVFVSGITFPKRCV